MTKSALISALMVTRVLAACALTIHVKVDPINIYAKLDANVRVQLDKEVQSAIQQNGWETRLALPPSPAGRRLQLSRLREGSRRVEASAAGRAGLPSLPST